MRLASNVGTHALTGDGRKVPMILKKVSPSHVFSSILDVAKIGDKFIFGDSTWVYTLKERNIFVHSNVTSDTGFREVNDQLVYIVTAYDGYLLVCEDHQSSMVYPIGYAQRESIKPI